jgi:hypothetical protein
MSGKFDFKWQMADRRLQIEKSEILNLKSEMRLR